MEDSMMRSNKNSMIKKLLKSLTFPRGGGGSGGGGLKSPDMDFNTLPKSKSWHSSTPTTKMIISKTKTKRQQEFKTPRGCFCVYVGEERQKFVIKTEFANHPLFKMLLEDAELEYGFNSDGPILIPCDVDLFCKVLAEMDAKKDDQIDELNYGCGSCSPFNPTRRLGRNSDMARKGYGSYGVLTPSRLLKLNHF